MRKLIFHLFLLLLSLRSYPGIAQSDKSADVLREEQDNLITQLHHTSIDSTIVDGLSRVINLKIDSIRVFISFNDALSFEEKGKATRSLVYFIKDLKENISRGTFNIYEIPGAFDSYKTILSALLYHRSFDDALILPGARRTQLLAITFSQYKEFPLLDDIAVYKRMSSSPEFIFRFLQTRPEFRYADSLILLAAAHDPLMFAAGLRKSDPLLQKNIHGISNIYLQKIITVTQEKKRSEL